MWFISQIFVFWKFRVMCMIFWVHDPKIPHIISIEARNVVPWYSLFSIPIVDYDNLNISQIYWVETCHMINIGHHLSVPSCSIPWFPNMFTIKAPDSKSFESWICCEWATNRGVHNSHCSPSLRVPPFAEGLRHLAPVRSPKFREILGKKPGAFGGFHSHGESQKWLVKPS